jgi:hypothetical protein
MHEGILNQLIKLEHPASGREFDDILVKSIDETISGLLSPEVLDAFYVHLEKVHSTSKADVPHRLELLCSTLEETLGLRSSKTVCRLIARTLYGKVGLTFHGNPDGSLIEYVNEAKIKLRERRQQL